MLLAQRSTQFDPSAGVDRRGEGLEPAPLPERFRFPAPPPPHRHARLLFS